MVSALPTIGFVGWNPFQLIHVRKLIHSLPGAVFVLEDRGDNVSEFDDALLTDPATPILMCRKGGVAALDGIFDILVFQTPFKRIHQITSSKVAMIQYGYAKEAHNYGAWRSFADVNLTYGPYASEKISYFSPTVSVGNPRFDDWEDPKWKERAREKFARVIDSSRKTVLYAPTWGDLSSLDLFLASVEKLSDDYNVLIKMHHNTDLLERGQHSTVKREGVHVFGSNSDILELLSVSDVFVSDYSGAIFDALYCEVPIVLANIDISGAMGTKIDTYSIEFSRRDDIGIQVSEPAKLGTAIAHALENSQSELSRVRGLKSHLFTEHPGACGRVVKALTDLRAGEFSPSQMQQYIRKEMKEQYSAKLSLSIAAANKKKAAAAKKPAAKAEGKA